MKREKIFRAQLSFMNLEEFRNSTILIIDDQPKNLDVLISSLERYGFDFLVAQNGEMALKRARQVRPDMVLLDILMPDMDGFEVCEQLKSLDGFDQVPVIFMSALNETIDKLRGFELGAVDYITKPFQLEEIIARIKTHLTIASLQKKLNIANQTLEEKVELRTQELRKEIELRSALENKYRILIETLQEGVWAMDNDGNTSYVNPRMAEMLGYPLEYLIEHTVFDFVPENFKPVAQHLLGKPNNESFFFDFKFIHRDGRELDVSIASSIMRNKEDLPDGVLIAVSDISKRRKAEIDLLQKDKKLEQQNSVLKERHERITRINKELILAKEKAEESDRLKTTFLANLSHEIRTPMNAIVGFSELLKVVGLPDSSKELYIEMIVSGTLQLKEIITDIIDISKLQAEQYPVNAQEISLHTFLSDIKSFASEELQKNQKTDLAVHIEPPTPEDDLLLMSDEDRLTDILKKLLKNAIKFTEKGRIEIGYQEKDSELEFFVSDTGIGIAKEAQYFIFEQFRQVEESLTKKFGGTGLGLAISKGFVELLGGKIWLESKLGNGSTFYFTIPYEKAS
ncbi:MAG: response regulator [Okeania sp. SIO3C4]|nr:response regulator [Okeania sp. SIO3C4]